MKWVHLTYTHEQAVTMLLTVRLFIIMSHSFLWRHIVLLTVCVYSSNHGVLYTILISMTRIFQNSAGPSVCLSVCNANKKKAYSIINSRKIIRISGERAYSPLQENEAIFKKFFSKILDWIFEKFCTCIKCLLLLHYKQ